MRKTFFSLVAVLSISLTFGLSVNAAELNFDGLPAGTISDELSTGSGITGSLDGSVKVNGFNPAFGPNVLNE